MTRTNLTVIHQATEVGAASNDQRNNSLVGPDDASTGEKNLGQSAFPKTAWLGRGTRGSHGPQVIIGASLRGCEKGLTKSKFDAFMRKLICLVTFKYKKRGRIVTSAYFFQPSKQTQGLRLATALWQQGRKVASLSDHKEDDYGEYHSPISYRCWNCPCRSVST